MSTKKQHYISRMILKNYTYFQIPMRKPMIYQYNLYTTEERLVDIRSVCFKKNLYEIKNECGIILDKERNLIENNFSKLEYKWNEVIQKLIIQNTISEKDRVYLYILVALQMLRTPEAIEQNKAFLKDNIKGLSEVEIDRYTKIASFICGKADPNQNWMLNFMLKYVSNKNIVIYVSKIPFIISGIRPVLCLGFEKDNFENFNLFFPVAPKVCLCLLTYQPKNLQNDLYIDVSNEYVKYLNSQIYQRSDKYIYGSESIKSYNDYCKKII